jgi:hypothetical protein
MLQSCSYTSVRSAEKHDPRDIIRNPDAPKRASGDAGDWDLLEKLGGHVREVFRSRLPYGPQG